MPSADEKVKAARRNASRRVANVKAKYETKEANAKKRAAKAKAQAQEMISRVVAVPAGLAGGLAQSMIRNAIGKTQLAERWKRWTPRIIGYLGGTSTYRVQIDDEHMVEITSPNMMRPKEATPPIDWDEEVYLSWDASSSVVLTK